jgi:SSS family solute:Na+ symporter
MAVMAVIKIGGLEGIDRAMNHHHLDFLSGDRLLPSLSMAFVIFVGVMATPSYRQRIYSSDTIATVKKSFYLSGSLYLLFSFIPALIGISAKTLNPDLPDIDFAFPFLVLEVLPIGLGLIVLIAGLSATMSSASSDAIAGVSILLRDIFILITGKMPSSERTVKLSRIGLTGITGTALLFTLLADNVISYINNMISIVMSGMFVAALLGRFWKRATWQGGLSAYLGGAACSILFLFQPEWKIFWGNSSIPSVICATLCCICVSTCTPQNNITNEEALDTLKKERDLIESTEHHV